MLVTLLQIAKDLGVDKQRVYRTVKQYRIKEADQSGQTKLYDEAAKNRIKSIIIGHEPLHHKQNEVAHDMVLDALMKQLEVKDQQIAALQQQISQLTSAVEATTESLRTAQALHAGTIQQQLAEPRQEDDEAKTTFGNRMKRWFRG